MNIVYNTTFENKSVLILWKVSFIVDPQSLIVDASTILTFDSPSVFSVVIYCIFMGFCNSPVRLSDSALLRSVI